MSSFPSKISQTKRILNSYVWHLKKKNIQLFFWERLSQISNIKTLIRNSNKPNILTWHSFVFFSLHWNSKMSMANESSWVGRKAVKRIGGMSDALSIAADLGFPVSSPSLTSSSSSSSSPHEPPQSSSPTTAEKGEDLIRVLRELTSVQKKIADLQVELQGRKVKTAFFFGSGFTHCCFWFDYIMCLFCVFRMIKMLHIWLMWVKWRRRLRLWLGLLLFLKMLFITR